MFFVILILLGIFLMIKEVRDEKRERQRLIESPTPIHLSEIYDILNLDEDMRSYVELQLLRRKNEIVIYSEKINKKRLDF